MGSKKFIDRIPLAVYGKNIREAPREVIFNRNVIFSAMLYATGAIPLSKENLAVYTDDEPLTNCSL